MSSQSGLPCVLLEPRFIDSNNESEGGEGTL